MFGGVCWLQVWFFCAVATQKTANPMQWAIAESARKIREQPL